MKSYIINENVNGPGKVFEEDDIKYVYFYDQESEVEISQELDSEELDTLKEFGTKEEMLEYLDELDVLSVSTYHGEAVAKYSDSIILNLDDLTMQTVEEIDCCEAIVIDSLPFTPSGQDDYKVYKLDDVNYKTYENDDIIASFTIYENSVGSMKVDLIYADNYIEPLGVVKDVSNYAHERTEAKVVDMEELFETLKEYLEEHEITEVYDLLVSEGVHPGYLPKDLNNEEDIER